MSLKQSTQFDKFGAAWRHFEGNADAGNFGIALNDDVGDAAGVGGNFSDRKVSDLLNRRSIKIDDKENGFRLF